jgi:valyl-tRNA synthetase
MPFITEELWAVTAEQGPARDDLLELTRWPELSGLEDEAAEAEIGWVIDLVVAIRSLRAEMTITSEFPVVLVGASEATAARAGRWADVIKRLARLSDVTVDSIVPPGSVQLVVRGEAVALPLTGIIDFAAEEARLEKDLSRVDADIARIDAKLGNPDFIRRAPEDVVEAEREKRDEAEARRAKIFEALERLKGAG